MFPTAESLRRLVPQGVRGSVWDPETERERETHTHTQRERVGDWGGPETGEWGYSTRRHMLGERA
jgi:hypothetical protein